jgi:hypothetical protein
MFASTTNIKHKNNSIKKNVMFYEFYTIKHIRNFEKYDVQMYMMYGRTYYVIFQKKYGTVLFGVNFSKIRENERINDFL